MYGKQGIKLTIECGFVEIVKDKLGNFFHTTLIVVINDLISMIILYKEAKYIFIGNGILNEIFVKAVAKYLFRCMSIYGIFSKNRSTRKTEYLGIIKELHNLLMAVPEMTAMALVKYHHDTRVADSVYFVAIPCLANCGIQFLNGGDDNLGITLKSFYKFVCIISTIHSSRFKCFIFRLRLCV